MVTVSPMTNVPEEDGVDAKRGTPAVHVDARDVGDDTGDDGLRARGGGQDQQRPRRARTLPFHRRPLPP